MLQKALLQSMLIRSSSAELLQSRLHSLPSAAGESAAGLQSIPVAVYVARDKRHCVADFLKRHCYTASLSSQRLHSDQEYL